MITPANIFDVSQPLTLRDGREVIARCNGHGWDIGTTEDGQFIANYIQENADVTVACLWLNSREAKPA